MSKMLSARTHESRSTGIVPPVVSKYADEEPGALTILVVGDHPLVAEGIRSIVAQMDLCGEALYASDATAAVKMLRDNSVDLVLLDLADDVKMEMLTTIREYDKIVPAIVLSVSESAGAVRKAVRAGASGFVVETAPLDFLRHAISVAVTGRRLALLPLDSVAEYAAEEESTAIPYGSPSNLRERYAKLTEQESRVLSHIREGMSNKEIARMLGILEGTVKVHVKSILRKLNAKNRTVAALMAAAMARTQ